jgi:hypothetical protein
LAVEKFGDLSEVFVDVSQVLAGFTAGFPTRDPERSLSPVDTYIKLNAWYLTRSLAIREK